jgi:8-oxo-dGTP diphosphatase
MPQNHTNVPASYLVLIKNNKVLLLRRYQTGYEDGNYSVIAGHVEQGENFTRCIIREAEEEAGIKLNREDLQVCHVLHRDSQTGVKNERVDVFFTTDTWEGEITNREPEKCDDLSWFEIDHLPVNMTPYIRQVLELISRGISYSEHGWT